MSRSERPFRPFPGCLREELLGLSPLPWCVFLSKVRVFSPKVRVIQVHLGSNLRVAPPCSPCTSTTPSSRRRRSSKSGCSYRAPPRKGAVHIGFPFSSLAWGSPYWIPLALIVLLCPHRTPQPSAGGAVHIGFPTCLLQPYSNRGSPCRIPRFLLLLGCFPCRIPAISAHIEHQL